jgi:hypothetical protein
MKLALAFTETRSFSSGITLMKLALAFTETRSFSSGITLMKLALAFTETMFSTAPCRAAALSSACLRVST